MKNIHFIWKCFWFLLIISLTGCLKVPSKSIGPCIDPPFNFAFPTYATAAPGAPLMEDILPGGDWQIETTIPGETTTLVTSIVIRGENEIWMSISQNENSFVYRYRTDTKKWAQYSSIDDQPVVPQGLIVSPDNTLWGVGWSNHKLGQVSKNNYSILSRLDEATEQFRFVQDNDETLQIFDAPSFPPVIQIDQNGFLWLILNRGVRTQSGLFRFDPYRKELTRHLSNLGSLSGKGSLAIAPNNDVWLFDPALESKLIHYRPQTGGYDDYFVNLSDWNVDDWSGGIFFDHSGNLWVGNNGWIDFSNLQTPVWYQIIRSPVFISNYYDGENQYVWLTPSDIFQSSNGWIWFASPGLGIIRLDVDAREWCRFTTEYSPVVEDNQQNIRIVVAGNVYLYKLR